MQFQELRAHKRDLGWQDGFMNGSERRYYNMFPFPILDPELIEEILNYGFIAEIDEEEKNSEEEDN